jgi:hypothetical protein
MKRYYTLLTRDNGVWSPQFGDYVLSVVSQERHDSYKDYATNDIAIITTGDTQEEINAYIKSMNKD